MVVHSTHVATSSVCSCQCSALEMPEQRDSLIAYLTLTLFSVTTKDMKSLMGWLKNLANLTITLNWPRTPLPHQCIFTAATSTGSSLPNASPKEI